MTLFEKSQVVGSFLGFSEGGLEFHADLILPYRNYFQSSPMHGQFVLVALENDAEAIVGRIAMLKAGLSDPNKPIGVFLFSGPTGTGRPSSQRRSANFCSARSSG